MSWSDSKYDAWLADDGYVELPECRECNGRGWHVCESCAGSGVGQPDADGDPMDCPTCQAGEGRVPCDDCHGTGEVREEY